MYVLYIYFSSLLFGEGIHGNVNEAESHRLEHYKTGATYENWTGGTSLLQVNAWSTVSEIPFDDRRPFWSRRRLLFRVYKKITQGIVRMIKESCSFSAIFFLYLQGVSEYHTDLLSCTQKCPSNLAYMPNYSLIYWLPESGKNKKFHQKVFSGGPIKVFSL